MKLNDAAHLINISMILDLFILCLGLKYVTLKAITFIKRNNKDMLQKISKLTKAQLIKDMF